MGEPVKIYDLAVSLIKLSGLEPNVDIEIKITGLRPGEKLYEELLMSEEGLTKTSHDKIFIGQPSSITYKQLLIKLEKLKEIIQDESISIGKIKSTMKQVVPTYKEPEEAKKEGVSGLKGVLIVDIKNAKFEQGAVVGKRIGKAYE